MTSVVEPAACRCVDGDCPDSARSRRRPVSAQPWSPDVAVSTTRSPVVSQIRAAPPVHRSSAPVEAAEHRGPLASRRPAGSRRRRRSRRTARTTADVSCPSTIPLPRSRPDGVHRGGHRSCRATEARIRSRSAWSSDPDGDRGAGGVDLDGVLRVAVGQVDRARLDRRVEPDVRRLRASVALPLPSTRRTA